MASETMSFDTILNELNDLQKVLTDDSDVRVQQSKIQEQAEALITEIVEIEKQPEKLPKTKWRKIKSRISKFLKRNRTLLISFSLRYFNKENLDKLKNHWLSTLLWWVFSIGTVIFKTIKK